MEMNAFLQAKQGASPAAFCIKTPPRVVRGFGSNALRKARAVFTKEQYITYMLPLFSALTACFPFTFCSIEGIICSNTQEGKGYGYQANARI